MKFDKKYKSTVIASIKKKYLNVVLYEVNQKKEQLTYQIKLSTLDTKKIIERELNKIDNLSVAVVETLSSTSTKIPRTFFTLVMVSLLGTGILIGLIAFTSPNNLIDKLSVSQLLVIQIVIALVIAIWIFLYDRKIQENIVDVLARLDLRINEINENVKDLDNDI